jgi:1-acyl-sn-glycerol-3-phosphate acyltransferase
MAIDALDSSLGVLQTGGVFGIYPEGTRSHDGRLYRGKVGVGWLALASGAPVIPIGMIDTNKVVPRGAVLPRPLRVEIHLGPPVSVAGSPHNPKDRRAATDRIMDAIATLTGQEQAGVYAPLR